MPATRLLCQMLGINFSALSKQETLMLEANLLSRICEELKTTYKIRYKDYFRTMKLNVEMENTVMEKNFVSCVINDILATDDYSLSGLALYTHAPEDVLFEIAAGLNTDPAASILRRIIELHHSIRPTLYKDIMKKILQENA